MNKTNCTVIAIANHKGGVSKSTSAVNISFALSILGFKTLIVDTDPQSNASQTLGVEDEDNTISEVYALKLKELPIRKISERLSLVPASLELSAVEASMAGHIGSYFILKEQLEKVRPLFDYVLIDTPPSLGVLTVNALIASDCVLIPVQAQFLSLKGLNTIQNLITNVKEKLNDKITVLGLLLTQVNQTRLNKDVARSLRETFKEKVFSTSIRTNVAIAEAQALRKDIFSYSPESHGAIDYMNLAKEIIQ